jgi:hypothetical protein
MAELPKRGWLRELKVVVIVSKSERWWEGEWIEMHEK